MLNLYLTLTLRAANVEIFFELANTNHELSWK